MDLGYGFTSGTIESVSRKYVIGCILIMILHGTLLYGTLQIIVI